MKYRLSPTGRSALGRLLRQPRRPIRIRLLLMMQMGRAMPPLGSPPVTPYRKKLQKLKGQLEKIQEEWNALEKVSCNTM